MLFGTIRPVETRTIDVEGFTLAELEEKVTAQTPAGWDVTAIPVRMHPGTTNLTATATITRVDGVRDIEADTMAALEALVPDGWQLLNVRSAR